MTSARLLLAAALAALAIGCTSVQKEPKEPEVPRSCGLPPDEGWTRITTPPPQAVDAIAAQQAGNPFREVPGRDSGSFWLGNPRHDQVAYCEYSGSADCGVGTTMIFHRSGDTWKQDDDVIITMCSKH